MVRKRIAGPKLPQKADQWVSSGGLDPELTETPAPDLQPQPKEKVKGQGKPYPHRISFDLTTEQYERLKRASFEQRRSLNEILREAADDWLNSIK